MPLEIEINGLFTDDLNQTVTYTVAAGTPYSLTAIFVPGVDKQILEATLEMQMRMGSLYIHEDTFSTIVYTAQEDTVTVSGVAYTVMERRLIGGVYHFILERIDVDAIELRARRF